jgi:hypothetical protein
MKIKSSKILRGIMGNDVFSYRSKRSESQESGEGHSQPIVSMVMMQPETPLGVFQ